MTALIGAPAGRTSAMHEKACVRKLIADRNNFEVAADGDLSSGRVSVGNDHRTPAMRAEGARRLSQTSGGHSILLVASRGCVRSGARRVRTILC